MRRLRYVLLLTVLSLSTGLLSAQDAKLAQQYYRTGEYAKSADMYSELYASSQGNEYYFNRWVESLIKLSQYDDAVSVVKKDLKRNSDRPHNHVLLGTIYAKQNETSKAEEQYELSLKNMGKSQNQIQKVAVAFMNERLYPYAVRAYEKGASILKDDNVFAYNLGDLYRRSGQSGKMVEQFIRAIETQPKKLKNVQNLLERSLDQSGYDTLKIALYSALQSSESVELAELLAWTFIQQEDYRGALRQYKSLDRRLGENGSRVYGLVGVASRDGDYDTAIDGCEYLISLGSDGTTYYLDAQQAMLYNKRKKLVEDYDYSQEELRELEGEYLAFLEDYGWNSQSAKIIVELAELEAFYLNDRKKAIEYLTTLIELSSLNKYVKAQAKIDLADIYIMEQEIWESTLLYSQVDKEFREELIGQEARFKNAKLSYYSGNFGWAQTQFDVLKSSTSRMISNDAIDLSVFITDNLGLDSTAVPMEKYAQADLLIFQNRFDEAIATLDEIVNEYPDHKLSDDILYSKAQIHYKRKEIQKAIDLYQQIVEDYPDEIRADNALFNLGYIYEKILEQPLEAQKVYERLFLEYTDSTFAVEARKKYRQLRGDNL